MIVPRVDWSSKSLLSPSNQEWTWAKEGDEDLLLTKFNGDVYKIDKTRGLLRETLVQDYAVRLLKSEGKWSPDAEYAVTAMKGLTVDDHINVMEVFAKHVDSAISKTVNLPSDYPYEDFKKLYMRIHDTGVIKGCTTYREGTMTSVLSSKSTSASTTTINKNDAVKRPKKLPCDIHHMMANGKKYLVLVGLLDKDPYEVFAIPNGATGDELFGAVKEASGILTKAKKGKYDLELKDRVIEDISRFYENDEQVVISRMISTSLRHGADMKFVIGQLMRGTGSVVSFSKCIGRTLKKYSDAPSISVCPECNSNNIQLADGCNKCLDCNYSGCA